MTISERAADNGSSGESAITLTSLLPFFLPLAATQFLIIFTHSLFNAGLARLPTPEVYLSAFAVAKSVTHLFQSPAMMIRQTVTALIDDEDSYVKVRRFIFRLVLLIVCMLLVFAVSGAARWTFRAVMGLDGPTLNASVTVLYVFILFPVAITFRNFVQGILIKFRMTPLITVATVMRIIYVSGMVVFVERLADYLPGGVIAGLMLLGAASIEGFVLLLGTKLVVKDIPTELRKLKAQRTAVSGHEVAQEGLSTRLILSFFLPLAVTSFMRTLAVPIINTGLARTTTPEVALSAYAVGWGLGMIVLSPLTTFHQLPLNYIEPGDSTNVVTVKRFAWFLGIGLSLTMSLLAFTPIGEFILTQLIGATEEISVMSVDVLKIMVVLPLIMVAREYYWGVLIKRHMTKYVSHGKTVNLIALVAAVSALTFIGPSNPATIGVGAMVICQAVELTYLVLATRNFDLYEGANPIGRVGAVSH